MAPTFYKVLPFLFLASSSAALAIPNLGPSVPTETLPPCYIMGIPIADPQGTLDMFAKQISRNPGVAYAKDVVLLQSLLRKCLEERGTEWTEWERSRMFHVQLGF